MSFKQSSNSQIKYFFRKLVWKKLSKTFTLSILGNVYVDKLKSYESVSDAISIWMYQTLKYLCTCLAHQIKIWIYWTLFLNFLLKTLGETISQRGSMESFDQDLKAALQKLNEKKKGQVRKSIFVYFENFVPSLTFDIFEHIRKKNMSYTNNIKNHAIGTCPLRSEVYSTDNKFMKSIKIFYHNIRPINNIKIRQ